MFMISRYASTNLLRTSASARNETFAFCISSMTCGSSTYAMRRAKRLEDHVAVGAPQRLLKHGRGVHGGGAARRLHLEEDVFGFDDRAFGEHHGALQEVVELAHVAGPVVGEEQMRN